MPTEDVNAVLPGKGQTTRIRYYGRNSFSRSFVRPGAKQEADGIPSG